MKKLVGTKWEDLTPRPSLKKLESGLNLNLRFVPSTQEKLEQISNSINLTLAQLNE